MKKNKAKTNDPWKSVWFRIGYGLTAAWVIPLVYLAEGIAYFTCDSQEDREITKQ